MTSLVYDFKDIAQRMKGELKAEDRLEPYYGEEPAMPHTCFVCNGTGQNNSRGLLICSYCKGLGVVS